MEDLFSPKAGSSKNGSLKSKSTFYSDLSFEDNFNPTSVNSLQTNAQSPEKTFVNSINNIQDSSNKALNDSPSNNSTAVKDGSENLSCVQGSPLMCYVLRLKHGNELRKTLLSFAQKNGLKAAFIMSCVGSAMSARLRLANAAPNIEANYMLDIVDPTEIVSLEGTLSGGGHIHVALSDSTGKMCGGHLLELIVDTTAEVVIGECSALSFSRTFDQSTGFNELNVNLR